MTGEVLALFPEFQHDAFEQGVSIKNGLWISFFGLSFEVKHVNQINRIQNTN